MKSRLWSTLLLLAAATGVSAATPAASPHPAPAPAAGASTLGALIAETGRTGKEARLPPHIVEALGLGAHVGGLAVRQLAVRQGVEVHAFNVSAENSRDVVMFDHNEATKDTLVLLVTRAAKLRRAVTYSGGGESHILAAPEGRRRLATELDYWLANRRSGSPVSR
ncbi:MAG TPA: hypothetical protein VF931_08570 [Steroidobacteraceae bacterium]